MRIRIHSSLTNPIRDKVGAIKAIREFTGLSQTLATTAPHLKSLLFPMINCS